MTDLRPMETAPRDGTRFLAFSRAFGQWHVVQWGHAQPFGTGGAWGLEEEIVGWVTDAWGGNPDNHHFDEPGELLCWTPLPEIPEAAP